MSDRVVYMDYSTTTYVKSEILEEMLPYFTNKLGSPSAFYGVSRESRMVVDTARERIAKVLNADTNGVYSTGGGSEADNRTIKGIAFAHKNEGNHIVTIKIEHHAVLHTCQWLKKRGFEVAYLDVNEESFVDLEELKNVIADKTILVSVVFANSGIGTIESVKEIGKICRGRKVILHTDAVQAVGDAKIDVEDMNVDLLSSAGYKVYGPKGIGALYIRKGIGIDNSVHGGGQERVGRAETENIPAIVRSGKAMEIAGENLDEHIAKISKLRDKLTEGLLEVPFTRLSGPKDGDKRLPGNVNVCFEFIKDEGILLPLGFEGTCSSSESACTSKSLGPSHVLLVIGLSHETAHGSSRSNLGEGTTEKDVDYVLERVPPVIARLRSMSSLWENHLREVEGKNQL